MRKVIQYFIVIHTYDAVDHHERTEAKFIGVFSSEGKALDAIDAVRSAPGFRDYPDGFTVMPLTLNAAAAASSRVTR